ncbi:fimbrial protein [Burkholderia ubonensis]|uniref:Fimbrial protein n=2 Tax=Burkholderia ubonensis TaxID=101571 RepID=A0A107FNJ0_9BURK|nr:fimbrial protein [Burkholderia ubonensis]KWD90451.1 fimbrial protein [Burkholderia ubonensis]KWD96792.1 fimbrial protein [Burkholderia ubonensis]KWE00279.1 fimbrial protein [Burkholderia ubonensis]
MRHYLFRLTFAVACALSLHPDSAMARCETYTNDGLSYYVTHFSGFNPPAFDPSAFAVGSVIYSYSAYPTVVNKSSSSPYPSLVSCETNTRTYATGIGMQSNNIYPTSIPNIGIRILNDYSSTKFPFFGSYWTTSTWLATQYEIRIELIKTGNITAGGVLSGAFAQYRANDANGQLLVEHRFASPVVVQPKVPTCKVSTPAVAVPMTSVHMALFKGVGTTTTPNPFEIALACSGGLAGTSTNAYVTLTDTTMPGNTSTTLSLTKDSMASGVGIQILKNGTPLGFGPDSAAVGNTNQWYAGTIAQGQANLKIPLSARYVQTGEKVTPGSANARATFTLSYQ